MSSFGEEQETPSTIQNVGTFIKSTGPYAGGTFIENISEHEDQEEEEDLQPGQQYQPGSDTHNYAYAENDQVSVERHTSVLQAETMISGETETGDNLNNNNPWAKSNASGPFVESRASYGTHTNAFKSANSQQQLTLEDLEVSRQKLELNQMVKENEALQVRLRAQESQICLKSRELDELA